MNKISGIYSITNKINNKLYIGQATDIYTRKSVHFSSIKYDRCHNKHLKNAVNKYGKDNFIFELLDELLDDEDITQAEQDWIDLHKLFGFELYNMRPAAKSNLGLKYGPRPDGVKKKISIAHLGKKHSVEHINNFRKVMLGRKLSPEHINNVANAMKKSVEQIDMKTNETIKIWNSITEASFELGIFNSSISRVCQGKYKSAGGYKWKYL